MDVLTGVLAALALGGAATTGLLGVRTHQLGRLLGEQQRLRLLADRGLENLRQEHSQRDLDRAQLDASLDELQRANRTFAIHQEGYIAALEAGRRELTALRQQLRALEGEIVVERRHSVLLDGMTGSGKTTILERLTNPSATRSDLEKIPATATTRRTDPVPLCWEHLEGRRVLHTLEFFDVRGEKAAQVVDNMVQLDGEFKATQTRGRAVALVLWNATAALPPEPGQARSSPPLTVERLETIYCTKTARNVVSSFVFFLNKIDLVRARLWQGGGQPDFERFIEQQHHILETEFYAKALSDYPRPELAMGSALEGTGLHDALGAILRQLGLAHLYAPQGV